MAACDRVFLFLTHGVSRVVNEALVPASCGFSLLYVHNCTFFSFNTVGSTTTCNGACRGRVFYLLVVHLWTFANGSTAKGGHNVEHETNADMKAWCHSSWWPRVLGSSVADAPSAAAFHIAMNSGFVDNVTRASYVFMFNRRSGVRRVDDIRLPRWDATPVRTARWRRRPPTRQLRR